MRFTTELVGLVELEGFRLDVRVVRSDRGVFTTTGSALGDQPYASVNAARTALEQSLPEARVTWHASTLPDVGETPCFVCGAVAGQRSDTRYPERLCPVCVHEAECWADEGYFGGIVVVPARMRR